MLRNVIVASEDAVLVYFGDQDEGDSDDGGVLARLEAVDDNLENEAVEFVRVGDRRALADYGLSAWPALVFFARGVPVMYQVGEEITYTVLEDIFSVSG